MVTNILAVLGGLIILLGAGEFLVRGAVGIARQLNVPTLLIGLTIVAFGTSAPELVVSVQAVQSGENGIAIGNIVGSNIANVLLVLGLPAVIASISTASPGLRRHGVVLLAATGLFAYIIYQRKVLDHQMGLILLALIALYVAYIGFSAMRPGRKASTDLLDEVGDLAAATGGLGKAALYALAGLIGLPVGGWLLVTYGAALASDLGVRDEIIGLTIVAFGTSLPELATVWAAATKRQADVAVGNIVGSNIFNILFVGGAAGLAGTTQFISPDQPGYSDVATTIDVPMMIGVAILLATFVFMRGKIGRVTGAAFFAAYVAYVIIVSAAAGG